MRHKKPENWMSALDRNGHGLAEERALEAPEQAGEALMMGLRLAEGVDLSALARRSGVDRAALVDERAVTGAGRPWPAAPRGRPAERDAGRILLLDRILGDIVAI